MEKVITLEVAKDGNYTCKVEFDARSKYLYSKYYPLKTLSSSFNMDQDKECFIVLGLGLGYELAELEKNTPKPIYVIDKDKTFFNIISENEKLRPIISNSKAIFLFGDEYEKIIELDMEKVQVIQNDQVMSLNPGFFIAALQFLNNRNKNTAKGNSKILFFHHPTIADDCIEALRDLGNQVIKAEYISKLSNEEISRLILRETPDYIFTINFYTIIAELCQRFKIPYISWTVDTPNYNLYKDEVRYSNNYLFIYDEMIVQDLARQGVENTYYMPVAANTKRLDQIVVTPEDVERYQTDVSFLGTTGIENEYNGFRQYLSNAAAKKIDEIFVAQKNSKSSLSIEEFLDPAFAHDVFIMLKENGITFNQKPLLSDKAFLAFLLNKKINELERIELVAYLSDRFHFKVYGDENWRNVHGKRLTNMGAAEHFTEMPKVFRLSKINVNLIRIYVDSGLPMRVFDVLGSQGFLVTNEKRDITKYFKDGHDLVIYRDLQDLGEITEYYLHHEQERYEIVGNGYERVSNEHTYEIRLKKIMELVVNNP